MKRVQVATPVEVEKKVKQLKAEGMKILGVHLVDESGGYKVLEIRYDKDED